MKILDRIVNPCFELACLLIAVLIGVLIDWRGAMEFALAMCLCGALLKMARTDRGVSLLYAGMPRHQVEYRYPGARANGHRPKMGNLTLRSCNGEPFTALIGVKVDLPALGITFHTFGRAQSNEQGIAIVRTWLGQGPVSFLYLCSLPDGQVEVLYRDEDQELKADFTNWPHLPQLFI